VELVPVDRATRDAALLGDLRNRPVAPGWPHDDSIAAMGFLDTGGWLFWIVDDDGRVAGECGTKRRPDADGVVEICYGLAPASRGRGLGRRAVAELLDWLGREPSVSRIEAEVHAGNDASIRILARLGLQQVGPPVDGYLRYRSETFTRSE
jgi:RimJ/RimL family protein N-acetyltransferase